MTDKDEEILRALAEPYSSRAKAEAALYSRFSYLKEEGMRKYHLQQEESFSAYSDTLISVLQNINAGKFDGRSSLNTYIYQIFSNKCVDIIRKNTTNKEQVHRAAEITDMLNQLPDNARTIVDKMIDNYKLDILKSKLNELGDKCKQMLVMYEEGCTDAEIASETGYQNASVVKTSRLRCLQKLKEKVMQTLTRQ